MTMMAPLATVQPISITTREPTTITWHSFDLRTGKRGQQLVTQKLGAPSRILGEATEVTGLPVLCYNAALETDPAGRPTTAGVVPGWQEATLPGRTMLVALNEAEKPMWAGMVQRRHSTPGPWVQLDLVTLEGYLDRRYVTDQTYRAQGMDAIITGVMTANALPTGVQFTIDAEYPRPWTITYADDDDKKVLEVLDELMALDNGPEFTVDLDWTDETHTQLAMILRVRGTIGGLNQAARFEMPGPVLDFTYLEDYSDGNGANDVVAISSGQGDERPESDHLRLFDLIDGGWALFEYRFTPATNQTDVDVLDTYANAQAVAMSDGLKQLDLVVDLDQGPRVNDDFFLGDQVAVALTCPRFPEQVDSDGMPRAGYEVSVRCIGWEADYDARQLKPTLVAVG